MVTSEQFSVNLIEPGTASGTGLLYNGESHNEAVSAAARAARNPDNRGKIVRIVSPRGLQRDIQL